MRLSGVFVLCLAAANAQGTAVANIAAAGYSSSIEAAEPAAADSIDDAQDRYNVQVQRIKQTEENRLHALGASGMTIDQAEMEWEKEAKDRLTQERAMLGQAVKDGKLDEEKAKEILEDDYHAVLEAAKLVEDELKQHKIVSADHTMPIPTATASTSNHAPHGSQAPPATATTSAPAPKAQGPAQSDNAHSDTGPMPPTKPSNPDAAEEQWEAEVAKIAAEEKKFLHALGASGMTVDEAETHWGEQVQKHLSDESKVLQQLVLDHRIAAEDAEERLRDDFNAAREAAKQVDAELNAHGIHPHHPSHSSGAATKNLRGNASQKELKAHHIVQPSTTTTTTTTAAPATTTTTTTPQTTSTTATATATATAAPAAGISQQKPAVMPAEQATTSKVLIATSNDTPAPTGEGSSHQILGMGVGAFVGIVGGCVALVALAVVALVKGSSSQSRGGLVSVVQGTRCASGTGSPTQAVRHTNFVQML